MRVRVWSDQVDDLRVQNGKSFDSAIRMMLSDPTGAQPGGDLLTNHRSRAFNVSPHVVSRGAWLCGLLEAWEPKFPITAA